MTHPAAQHSHAVNPFRTAWFEVSQLEPGVYLVSERVRRIEPPVGLGRLREHLAWLLESGEPMYGDVIETVVDVDRAEDVALAEALAARAS